MHSNEWFRFTRVCLWFMLLVHSSVAVANAHKSNLENWIRKCNCSCLYHMPNATKPNSSTSCETAEEFTINKKGNLRKNNSILRPLNAIPVSEWLCESNVSDKSKVVLLNLSCKGERTFNAYLIYKQKSKTRTSIKVSPPRRNDSPRPTTTPKKKEKKETNTDTPKGLIVGLTICIAVIFTIVVCWMGIRWRIRRKKKKADERQQNPELDYIDEEEDSVPYRIVDLQTNISCDASGYTFLEATNQDEEKPYQKLQPKCSRADKKESKEAKESFEEIEDEPVYFLLEGKENLKTS